MAAPRQLVRDVEAKLARFSPALPADFRDAADRLADALAYEDLRSWADEGVALAGHSLRSWEAAVDYFRVSPEVVRSLQPVGFLRWVHAGRELTEHSSVIAGAYFRASPGAIRYLSEYQITEWAALGMRLYKGHWKSISLASAYFTVGPRLLPALTLGELARLVALIEQVGERSYELAASCLDASPQLFEALRRQDRAPFLTLAAAVADMSWADVRALFEKTPGLLGPIEESQRARLLELGATVSREVGRHAFPLFAEALTAMAAVSQDSHEHLCSLSEELAVGSPVAAMEFLKSAPEVLKRVKVGDLARWHAAGHAILRSSREGGEAYFRMESGKGEEVLQALTSRVDLSRIGDVLRLYCKALTGTNVSIHPTGELAEKGIGWVSERLPTTEGTTVYLPEFVEEHVDKRDNFAVYKVYATHQAAHLEFGSFRFRFDRPGALYGAEGRAGRERERAKAEKKARRRKKTAEDGGAPVGGKKPAPLTDMERYFDLFEERQLAADLFTIVEDARIDSLVRAEYSGIRRSWRQMQEAELEHRPDARFLPLRQALLENLVRASLDGGHRIVWPRAFENTLTRSLALLASVRVPYALVEDSAEATLQLYDLAMKVPNVPPEALGDLDWNALSEETLQAMMASAPAGDTDDTLPFPQGEEVEYESPQQVDFRGDFKPELVQLLMRLRMQEGDTPPELSPLTAEQLKELLEKSVEISVGAMAEADLASTIGLFLSNLEKEAGTPIPDNKLELPDGTPVEDGMGDEEGGELPREVRYFYYDEWDFRAADYKPGWCRVVQQALEEGSEDFYAKTLRDHAPLVNETRRQFELLKPELFRKLKAQYDGEEFDLDAVVDYAIERKGGYSYTDKVYWRRNKIERDVAVAFLLDMSASTDEEIEKRRQSYQEADDFDDDPRKYFQWLAQRKAQHAVDPPKRIIDLEKESTVLLIRALETIGDAYGIYGFSGYGRDNVEFYVIKDISEAFSDRVARRIDKVSPIRSTRMGPAIRHVTSLLDGYDAKVKILFLVSDGRPQDHGYGRDRTEKEYAIHDTKMALTEARRRGITPFALTVDKEGHDYLGQMCEDMGYEVVADIEALPSRLPTLYRRLTQ